jgi:hypothetical protein
MRPIQGQIYRAGDLPPRSVVRHALTDGSGPWGPEYVRCERIPSVMRWEQPIPGSENWRVVYVGTPDA